MVDDRQSDDEKELLELQEKLCGSLFVGVGATLKSGAKSKTGWTGISVDSKHGFGIWRNKKRIGRAPTLLRAVHILIDEDVLSTTQPIDSRRLIRNIPPHGYSTLPPPPPPPNAPLPRRPPPPPPPPPPRALVVGISGVTRSGKSSLAKAIAELFGNACVISQDDYFDVAAAAKHDAGLEHSLSINHASLLENVEELIKQQRHGCLIVEGYRAFFDEELLALMDVTIWLTLDHDTCLARVLMDKRRAGTKKCKQAFFRQHVWPQHEQYARQVWAGTKRAPDLTLSGTVSRDAQISVVQALLMHHQIHEQKASVLDGFMSIHLTRKNTNRLSSGQKWLNLGL